MRERYSGRQGGFSMIELLVTLVLAGVIFAAMVPLFANALRRTSADNFRVSANNIAQDRIENVRLLASTSSGYLSITQTSLNTTSTTLGDGRFGPTYTMVGSNKSYDTSYTVDSTPVTYKKVTVAVTGFESKGRRFTTTMNTIIKDPMAATTTTTSDGKSTWTPKAGGYKLTATFKDATQVTDVDGYDLDHIWQVASGVVVTSVSPTGTVTWTPKTPTPPVAYPLATKGAQMTWTGLSGGPDFTYTVTCDSRILISGKYTYHHGTSPPFHLLKDGRLKFDTNPGGS